MRLILAGIALLFVVGCKVNQSQLADSGNSSGAVCSPELAAARVKGQGSTNSGGPTGLALNGEEDPAYYNLRGVYTFQFKLPSSEFQRALNSVQTRESDLGIGCTRYAKQFVEKRCSEEGCKLGWFGVDTEKQQRFFNFGIQECRGAFDQYFATSQNAENPPVEEQPEAGAGTSAEPATDPGTQQAMGPENCRLPTMTELIDPNYAGPYCQQLGGVLIATETDNPQCECSAATLSLADLADSNQAARCGRYDSNSHGFQACINLGQEFKWDSNLGVCKCIVNPKVFASNKLSINQMKGQCVAAAAPTAAANPPAAVKVAPTAVPPKPKCECRLVGTNKCQKFVNDVPKDYLTVQTPNPVTKRNETCIPNSTQGGYDNLCNQPQIKKCD